MSKPFFYRLDAARYLSEMARITDDAERGKVALALAFDLVDGKGNTQYSRSIIAEAKAFSNKKSEAGKKGMNNRWLKDNTVITETNTDIAVLPFDITNAVITRSSSSTVKNKTFVPPSAEEVTAYCLERNRGVNPDKWMAHYQSNGWKVGKNSMKDWKAAVRTWEKDELPITMPIVNGNPSWY